MTEDKKKKKKNLDKALRKHLINKADQADELAEILKTAVKHASEQFIAKLVLQTDELEKKEGERYIGLGLIQKTIIERTTAMLLTNKANDEDGYFPIKLTVDFGEIMNEEQISELALKNEQYKDIDLVVPTKENTAEFKKIKVADLTKDKNSAWTCPYCGEEMDYLADHRQPPRVNDVIVCSSCFQVGVLLKDKTIRKATAKEIKNLKRNNPDMWKSIREYKQMKKDARSQVN